MRILAIGDPHGDLAAIRKIPIKDCDAIVLTGDLGSASLARKRAFERIDRERRNLPEKTYSPKEKKRAFMEPYTSTVRLVRYLARHAPVYTVFGNIECSNQETKDIAEAIGLPLPFIYDALRKIKGVTIINNRIVKMGGIRIGGVEYFLDASWVQEFRPKDYAEHLFFAKKESKKVERLLQHYGKIDLLVAHQPPYKVLDKVTAKFAPAHWRGKHAGSKVLLQYIKKTQPTFVVCGHIHEGEGRMKVGKTQVFNLGVAGYAYLTF